MMVCADIRNVGGGRHCTLKRRDDLNVDTCASIPMIRDCGEPHRLVVGRVPS
jgi:hypothetical protein